MKTELKNIPCFGVAGNFTGHLEQAGEARDFTAVKAAAGAPKAVFPTYIPCAGEKVPAFLNVFPFDSSKVVFPKGEEKIQIESECAVICRASWKDRKLESLVPVLFGASNDVSIRKEGAPKISFKKNWGSASKGLSDVLLPVDSFTEKGIMNSYSIACFMIRNGEIFEYGETSRISTYSYIYERLQAWLMDRFNNQIDEGPAERVYDYLEACGFPEYIMVSIGATRYTEFGCTNFFNDGDESAVILFPHDKYTVGQIKEQLKERSFADDVSFLVQKAQIML